MAIDGGGGDGATAILRQTLALIGAEGALMHEQIDCADLALATGHADAARLLYGAAFLRGGFSRLPLRAQARIAARTGLWNATAWDSRPATVAAGDFTLDRTLRALGDFIAQESDPAPGRELTQAESLAQVALPLPIPLDPLAAEPLRVPDAAAVADLVTRLCEALRRDDVGAVAAALDRVAAEILAPTPLVISDHVAGPVLDIAAAVAVEALREFFLLNHDLCWPPFGSAALFTAAARLEDGGLGPYFSNARNLVRASRDLFGLVQRAGGGTRARLERWLVVLATHLDHDSRVALADEAGDRGLTIVLRGLLAATRRTPGRGTYLFWAIRDAALDNGDIALAADAQASITRLSHGLGTEWVVLAEILGTGGADQAAETALIEALRRSRRDEQALERLDALREGRFEPYHALHGFGSPPWRIALRARNRASVPEAAG